jgi:PhoPQ-activated pathogenicity-related protein
VSLSPQLKVPVARASHHPSLPAPQARVSNTVLVLSDNFFNQTHQKKHKLGDIMHNRGIHRVGLLCLTFVAYFASASAVLLPAGTLPIRKYARTGITRTALDEYVDKPDSNYAFNIVKEEEGLGFTAIFVNMTSQQWLTPQLVSRSIWFHGLVIMIPHKIVNDEHAFLYITGGGNDNPNNIFCKLTDEDCALGGVVALTSGTIFCRGSQSKAPD